MKTICEILGVKYPLIQGAMARIATGAFAASVSNAGALGIIAAGGLSAEQLRVEIKNCRSITSKPFGVNIMLMDPAAAEIADVVVQEGVKVLTTGAGNPGVYMAKWKAAGISVLPVVPSVALARRLERAGADALIAEGCEAGGHIGDLTTMALTPQVAAAVGIPVLAAGGVASGAQLLAALALGAQGVQVGTCLLVSEECPIHENYKAAIIKAGDTDTTVTGRITGAPVRIIKNAMSREYLKREKEGAGLEELESFTLGSLRRAVCDGDTKNGSLMAGQVAGMCGEIRPVKDIIEGLFSGCAARWDELAKQRF